MGSSQSSHPADIETYRASRSATGEESSPTTKRPTGEPPSVSMVPRQQTQTSPAPNQKKPRHSSSGLSGMPLVHHVCRKKKRLYDTCVAKHYQNFVLGATSAAVTDDDGVREPSLKQEEVCGDRFEAYRECILKGIKKEIWEKQGLPPPGEGSPLAEVADD